MRCSGAVPVSPTTIDNGRNLRKHAASRLGQGREGHQEKNSSPGLDDSCRSSWPIEERDVAELAQAAATRLKQPTRLPVPAVAASSTCEELRFISALATGLNSGSHCSELR